MVVKNKMINVYDRLENAVIKIYEGLCNQIKENKETSETASIEDLETKIDVIMDALGLVEKEEDKEDEKEEVVDTLDVKEKNNNESEEEEEIVFVDNTENNEN